MSTTMFLPTRSGFRTHSGSHQCPRVRREAGQPLQSVGSLGQTVVVVFPKSKLTPAVIALEHPLWSSDVVHKYYNLEIVRGSLRYILCPGYTLNLATSLNLYTGVGHCPSRIPLKQFHFSSHVAEDTSGCSI